MMTLQNPLFFDVFIDVLATLSLEGETDEIALTALRLQTLLLAQKEVSETPREEKIL